MPNYSQSSIYKICCLDTSITDIYVGSTTNFNKRKHSHKSAYNSSIPKYSKLKVYNFIRENGGWENWSMVEIKKFNCNDKRELYTEEMKIMIEHKSTLNSFQSITTKDERKEKMRLQSQKFRDNNPEKIRLQNQKSYEKGKIKISCECGGLFTKNSLSVHKRTNIHKLYLNNLKC
jgi:hypothetical protein